jgi:hypothetical protein
MKYELLLKQHASYYDTYRMFNSSYFIVHSSYFSRLPRLKLTNENMQQNSWD